MNELPAAIADCGPTRTQITEWLKITNSVIQLYQDQNSLTSKIWQNSFSYHKEITRDVDEGMEKEVQGFYETAGFYYGLLSYELVFQPTYIIKTDQQQENQKFIEGFFFGIFNEESAGNLTQCLQKTVAFIEINQDIFKQNSVPAFVQGLQQLKNAFVPVQETTLKCMDFIQITNIKQEYLQLYQKLYQDPYSLAQRVTVNYLQNNQEISVYINLLRTYIQNNNYREAGKNIGKIVKILIY